MLKKLNFTKAAIQALPIPETGKRDVYQDTEQPGLQLRVTSTGAKSFSVYRRVKGGRPQRITLGKFPDVSVSDARTSAKQVVAKLSLGVDGRLVPHINKESTTLEGLFWDFLENRRNRRGAYLSPASKSSYETIYRQHLSKFGRKRLEEITDTQLAALHTRLGREHPTQANRVIAVASSLFSYAQERKLFKGQNPAAGIKKFPETARDRFIQADELPRFFRALAIEPNETVRDLFLASLLTGARRSNVLAMRWADVRLERGEWRLHSTKNGTPQTVHLSPEMVEMLRARKRAQEEEHREQQAEGNPPEFVFPGTGETGHFKEPRKGWRRILDRAEAIGIIERLEEAGHGDAAHSIEIEPPYRSLPFLREIATRFGVRIDGLKLDDLRIHDLRRTLGSWQAKTGASLAIIGKSLNHKSTSTTAIYARLDLDPVRESVNNATSAMLAAAGLTTGGDVVPMRRKK